MSMVRGVVFCLLLYLTATLGGITMLYPLLPYLLLPTIGRVYLFRWLSDLMLGGYWNSFVVLMMRYVGRIEVKVFGDAVNMNEGSLFIMNHRTRLDWLYIWDALVRFGDLNKMKVILKSELKKVPGPGWSMQYGLYVFLKRRWQEDKMTIVKICRHFGNIYYKPQLLLFPEGTDLTQRTRARSDEFAEKNQLPKYQYVLHPRTTGFNHLVQQMKQNKLLDAVYDVTVAYPRGFPQDELSLVKGNFPPEVHFHIRRFSVSELPDETGLDDWCCRRWAEKETLLHDFYAHSSFKALPSPGQRGREISLIWRTFVMLGLPILGCYLIYTYPLALCFTLLFLILHISLDRWSEGFDMVQIDIYNRLYGKRD